MKRCPSKTTIIIIGLLLLEWFHIPAKAQDDIHFELWSKYTTQHYVTKYRFWFMNDIGIRHSFDYDPSTMFLLRPKAIIELASILDFHPAVDFRYSHFPNSIDRFELRTWQGLNLHWPDFGRVMFDHFYRFEQRFYWTEGVKEEDISLRSRYRLNMRVPLNNRSVSDKTFFIDLRGELFFPHDDGLDEIFASTFRTGLNVGYQHNPKWRYQMTGYIEGGKDEIADDRSVSRYMIEASIRTSF